MNSTKRTLLVSGSVILLCMAVIVGTTFALFTDTQKVTNHLQAGDLNITLKRVELLKTTLNAEGYLVTPTQADTTVKDFTQPTAANVFDIATNDKGEITEKFVPGSRYHAKMQIENHSDVAFGYWIEIVCTDETEKEDLAKQVKVYVNDKSDVIEKGLRGGDDKNFLGVIEKGKSGTFTVTVEFLDKKYTYENGILTSKNNLAMDDNLKFDLVVYAVQVITDSTP